MDVRDLLGHMRDTPSDRAVARDTGFDRRTVRRYRAWALAQGFLTDPLPALELLHTQLATTLPDPLPPQNASTVEPYRTLVTALREQGVEIRAIWQRLQERGYTGSYPSVHRFVQRLDPRAPDACHVQNYSAHLLQRYLAYPPSPLTPGVHSGHPHSLHRISLPCSEPS
jgi:hypothetical protein